MDGLGGKGAGLPQQCQMGWMGCRGSQLLSVGQNPLFLIFFCLALDRCG